MSKAPDLTGLTIPRKGHAAPAVPPEPGPANPPQAAPPPSPPAAAVAAPSDAPRTTVSTRLTLPIQERLRRAAFETRREKQDLIEAALDRYLASLGF